jgi:hypothetical protein
VEPLDKILSGKGDVTSEPETTEPTQVAQPEADSPAAEAEPGREGEGGKTVPLEALHAERQKAKRYTEQVADFERKLKEQDAAWERRFGQLLETVGPKAQPREQPQPTDWYSDPDVAFRQRGAELIHPVVNQLEMVQSELAKMKAAQEFGDKYQDFISLVIEADRNGDPEVRVLSAMMDASPQPFKVAREWFERRTFDPAAKEAEIEARVLEKYGIKPDAKPRPVQSTTMPTPLEAARNVGSRTGPAWSGPTPLNDIFKR